MKDWIPLSFSSIWSFTAVFLFRTESNNSDSALLVMANEGVFPTPNEDEEIDDYLNDDYLDDQPSSSVSPPPPAPLELKVPEDYATIEEAYAAATPGSTIVLAEGSFAVPEAHFEKSIELRGAGSQHTRLTGRLVAKGSMQLGISRVCMGPQPPPEVMSAL